MVVWLLVYMKKNHKTTERSNGNGSQIKNSYSKNV